MGEPQRIVGFNPGPTKSGWCVAELALADRGMVRFIRGGQCRSIHEEFCRIIEAARPGPLHPLLLVGVEQPEGFIHQHARGAQLLETARVAGEIAGLARLSGYRVAQLPAGKWRHALAGKNNASDALVARACAMFVRGMPKKSNSHVRDALGLAVVVLRNPGIAKGMAA